MLDSILSIGRAFDWISPTLRIFMNIAHGPSHTLMIPQSCGRTGAEIARLLRKHGIKTWGHMIVKDTFMISVKRKQARWAEYVLTRAGIPLGYGSVRGPSGSTDRGVTDTLKNLGNRRIL
jgi:hypothetical protein